MRKTLGAAAATLIALTLTACGSSDAAGPAGSAPAPAGASSGALSAASPASGTSGPAAATDGSGSSAAPSAVAAPTELVKAGTLTVCIDPEYPPLEYFAPDDTSTPIGFDADGAAALAKLWGLSVTWQVTAFDGLIPALQAKRCDLVWSGLFTNPERLAVADGAPYLSSGPGLVVKADNTTVTSADSLAGATVAVQGGGANEATLTTLSDGFVKAGKAKVTIQPYPKTAETVAAVTNGKADALIETDVAVADMVAKSNGALKAVPNAFPADTTFGVFTVKGSAMSAAVSAGLKALDGNGDLAALATKYGLDPAKITT